MYACICRAVSVTAVELAVLEGATTVAEIGAVTGAGTGCGSCHERLDGIIERVTCPVLALRSA